MPDTWPLATHWLCFHAALLARRDDLSTYDSVLTNKLATRQTTDIEMRMGKFVCVCFQLIVCFSFEYLIWKVLEISFATSIYFFIQINLMKIFFFISICENYVT